MGKEEIEVVFWCNVPLCLYRIYLERNTFFFSLLLVHKSHKKRKYLFKTSHFYDMLSEASEDILGIR